MHSRSSDGAAGWGFGDALSSVLLDLNLSGTFFCVSEFAAPWSLAIEARDFASFHFVARGECWLQSPLAGEAVKLEAGDLAFVARSPPQVLASRRRRTGTPLDRLPARPISASASSLRLGKEKVRWHVVCGGVRLEGFAATTLMALVPDVIVVRRSTATVIVAEALEAMRRESLAARPGSATIMTRLADVMVIHALRGWIEDARLDIGWLAALRDPEIGRAMAEVHRLPERAWTVASLARVARLSRSHFSERFGQLAGTPPMQYVTKVQMQRASELLRGSRLSIAELAARFGYDSAPAFARAFKRHVGKPPGSVRRQESKEA